MTTHSPPPPTQRPVSAYPTLTFQAMHQRLKKMMHDAGKIPPAFRDRHQNELRVVDIAAYIGRSRSYVVRIVLGGTSFTAEEQHRVSRFLAEWDAGNFVKDGMPPRLRRIRGHDEDAEIPAPPPPDNMVFGVQMTPSGPRLRRPDGNNP